MKKRIKTVFIILLIVLAGMQFFRIDKTNPPYDPASDFMSIENPPTEVAKLMKDACYDCHSHLTKYPWYTNIAPLSWWIAGHIREGREHLNLSEWRGYNQEDRQEALEEMAEEVEKKNMPLNSYTWGHPEARLSDAQRQLLAEWFKSRQGATGIRQEAEAELEKDD